MSVYLSLLGRFREASAFLYERSDHGNDDDDDDDDNANVGPNNERICTSRVQILS